MLRSVLLVAAAAEAAAFLGGGTPALHTPVLKTPMLQRPNKAAVSLSPRAKHCNRLSASPITMQLASSAGPTLAASQSAAVDKIKASRSMEAKGYPDEMGFGSFTIGDGQGTLQAYEAPGANNVAWCSSLNIAGPSKAISSLTMWCGPIAEVPHLCARTVVTDNSVDLFIDFRPRAYGAYETVQPDGGYGEPATREWFTHKAVRDTNTELFFTPPVVDWAAAIRAKGTPKPPATGDDLLYRGPLAIDVSFPADDASVAMCAAACAEAAAMWDGWMATTPPLPAGMKVTSTYAYDTKMRAQMFGVLVGFYTALFGDQGRSLAAADAGPLDEAYVGGAS
eukprot:CAMPEP_0173379222 /NCGR_PEP_ID=MMETSP1356-20130122/2261_1 /TAXON_ID=77927 ORGANISM="Hemiselmis virescens, Strain PCC157" /NCGR_SAMPLE_ID=MMETSP1356 /ASSEMBLY_ACC=CAM_ASM_000847 /LENGTH=336 /DNA_ID=CAMNT_0014332527 /DNA_START=21 /DNA_END=1031 /DNA_ORIENTATION=+